MVADLLDHHHHEARGQAGSPTASDLHLQVTGKVTTTAATGTSASSPSSSPASSGGAVQTSVIRRGPDSPDSSHEDSTWFLRQVLQQQQQQQQTNQQSRESGAGTPLTPATSPVRGVRRARQDSDEDEEDEDEELKKNENDDDDDDDIEEEKKRARVESIISTMRTSTPAINGCKKRKLYQPQQHGQQAKFTSEGEEEEDDERNDSMSEQELVRAHQAAQHIQQTVHDPIRSLQERIASLHQQRFAALHHQQQHQQQMQQQQQQQQSKPVEQVQQQPPVRRPVRDDAGRTRNPLHQPQFARSATLPGDLSHVSQAHAAYLDATRRLLMDQQRQQQPARVAPPQTTSGVAAAPPPPAAQQAPKEQQTIPQELEGLAEMLKSELASSLAQLVDSTLSRFAQQQQQKRNKSEESELSKLQRGRVIDRGLRNGDLAALGLTNPFLRTPYGALPHIFQQQPSPNAALNHIVNSIGAGIHPAAAAAAAAAFVQQQQQQQQQQPQSSQMEDEEQAESNEQDEALSLVVSPKKKRVNNNNIKTAGASDRDSPAPGPNAETRLSPLELSLMNHSSANSPPPSRTPTPPNNNQNQQQQQQRYNPAPSASSQPAGPPPPLLHHPSLFTNYSAYFAAAAAAAAAAGSASTSHQRAKSPVNELDLTSPSTSSLLHPALLASHHQHPRHPAESIDRQSESSDRTSPYGSVHQSSTLTPMHLRKAKLMFFWCRYPSSSVLKTFFPDVNFNKNNTAQLVKWFSNFREFYYIQMEKYSRQLLAEGVVNADDIHVSVDSELFRALNLHYNRNNHIEVPSPFIYVVSETLREFFKAIQAGKDAEPSWKKAIYKIIARLDEPVPEYFRTPNFLEHLE